MPKSLLWTLIIILGVGLVSLSLRSKKEEANLKEIWNDPSIFGKSVLSAKQLDQYVKRINPNAPNLGSYYIEWGNYYGIRGDVAFAQSIHETGWFRFGGDVVPEQNNYAGIGATGGGTRGHYFRTPEEGVIGQMQHIYAYATSKPLPESQPIVDPRFHLVRRGSAPTWPDLDGKWAVPGVGYGNRILNIWREMVIYFGLYKP
ncbi:MAG: glucosaminidase domain-containing protein [Firmicutes bacterium]|nr:glucosaminidase domain-containing protein [Bacillota bacterium]MDD4263364.1 glucosaminidase domain-containing protein [Bacillota bacterium]MDD4693386.1 glucosaminidase domain-containing protein [Bacillota bacterium]